MHMIWTESSAPVIQTGRGFEYISELRSEDSLESLGAHKALSFMSSQTERPEELQVNTEVFIMCDRSVHRKFKCGF